MVKENPYINKYHSLISTPYSKTVYLDNDIICLKPFRDLFLSQKLLVMSKNESYDISLLGSINELMLAGSSKFPWYNTGVLVYDNKFVKILEKYEKYTDFIPELRHYDQSLISFIIYHEQIDNNSAWC
jgi:lipopolysaccharide biosynthesis glycosyltransferase